MATLRDMINTNYGPYSNPLGGTGASRGGGNSLYSSSNTNYGKSTSAGSSGYSSGLPDYGSGILGTFLKMIEYLKPESIGEADTTSSGVGGTSSGSSTASGMGLTNDAGTQAASGWKSMGYGTPKTGSGGGSSGTSNTKPLSDDPFGTGAATVDDTEQKYKEQYGGVRKGLDYTGNTGTKPQAVTNLPAGSIGQQIYAQSPAGTPAPVVTGGTQAAPAVSPAATTATAVQPNAAENPAAALGAFYDPITGKWNWDKLNAEYGAEAGTGDTGGA